MLGEHGGCAVGVDARARVGNPVGGSTVKPLPYRIESPYSVVTISQETVREYPFKSLAHEFASNIGLRNSDLFADVGPTLAEIKSLPIILPERSLQSPA